MIEVETAEGVKRMDEKVLEHLRQVRDMLGGIGAVLRATADTLGYEIDRYTETVRYAEDKLSEQFWALDEIIFTFEEKEQGTQRERKERE